MIAISAPEMQEIDITGLLDLHGDGLSKLIVVPEDETPVVTLHMPMERKGAETRKNHIIFKNAIDQARCGLTSEYLRQGSFGAMLDALKDDLDSPTHSFWQHQEEGLIMVITPNLPVKAIKVPFPLEPRVWVGDRPHLGQLFRLNRGNFHYVLALDLNELKLFRATRWGISRVPLNEDIPSSLEEAMRYDDPEKSLQWNAVSGAAGAGRGSTPMYHGHGSTNDEEQDRKVRRYFEMVSSGLASHFHNQQTPLVLFGKGEEIGIYRDVNHYHHLLEDYIDHHPGNLGEEKLRRKICDWLSAREDQEQEGELASLESRIATGDASVDLQEIVRRCAHGRVDTLFVKADELRFGHHDASSDQVVLHDQPEEGDEELIDASMTRAGSSGARIRFLNGDASLPGNAPLAAVFRY